MNESTILKDPPPPPPKKQTHTPSQVTEENFKGGGGGGGFHVQYRGNVLLWSKSDESKKKPGPLLLVYFMVEI